MGMIVNPYAFGLAEGAGPTPTVLGVPYEGSQASNVVDHQIPITTADAGDLLIAAWDFTSATATCTAPAGWISTPLFDAPSDSGLRLTGFYKIADGTEGGTSPNFVTSVGIRGVGHMIRIQKDTYSGVPVAATANNPVGVAGVNPDPPNLAPPWGAGNTLWLIFLGAGASVTVSAYPGSNGVRSSSHSTNAIASCRDTTPGASLNPGTFTISTAARWGCATVGIRAK